MIWTKKDPPLWTDLKIRYDNILLFKRVISTKVVEKRSIIMSNTITEKDTSLFGSGTIWFITCVVVTALPTLCSCIFRFVTENEILTMSLFLSGYLFVHLKDILLITFSISCSLLTLSIDKSKIIKKTIKKIP